MSARIRALLDNPGNGRAVEPVLEGELLHGAIPVVQDQLFEVLYELGFGV
jgi:hypothetical protein